MMKYIKLENVLNKISTGQSDKGPFYQLAGTIQQLSESSTTVENFIDKLTSYLEEKIGEKSNSIQE